MKIELTGSVDSLSLKIDKQEDEKVKGFAQILNNFIKDVNQDLLKAKEVESQLASGKVENIQEAIFLIEKADISLRLLIEIRNKVLESYQEIMRMQV